MLERIKNLLKTTFARLTFRGEPSPECWVFSSVHNRTFNYNSSYLFLYVKEHCPDIHPYYVMNDDKKRKELEEKYGMKIHPIVTMAEVIEHLYNKEYKGKVIIDDKIKAAIDAYYEQYGVKN